MYTYMENESLMWVVGFHKPNGKWVTESSHTTPESAAKKVAWLNGGYGAASLS